jgi:carboxyl-terminal processing protease
MQVAKSKLYNDVGYVRLTMFNDDTEKALRDAIEGFRKSQGNKLRGIVLDLRNNPGGLLDQAVEVSDDFLSKGTIVSTRGRHGNDDHVWKASGGELIQGLPVVVLINNGSASASEIVAGALQDNGRAVVLGTRSFGKGSVQTLFPLRGDGAIRLTTARYYTPDGRSIQGQGITPDVVVHESDKPESTFGPTHESDLNNTLKNGEKPAPPRPPVPLAAGIPDKPPAGWPKYDPTKPETDFQLQQALKLVQAMANAGKPGTLVAPGSNGGRPI